MRYKGVFFICILTGLTSTGCEEKKGAPQAPAVVSKPATSESAPRAFPYVVAVTAETPHQIGRFDASMRAMATKRNEVGAVVFGPYLPLEPGTYRAMFKISAKGPSKETVGKVDVNAFSDGKGENPVAAADVKPAEGDQHLALDFQGEAGMRYEFRIWANGKGELFAREVVIERK